MCLTAQCTSTSCSTPSSSWLPVLPPILFTSTTLSGLSSILKQPVSVNYTNKLRHYRVSEWGINKGCKHIETRIPRMEFMPTALINQNNKRF